MKELSVEEKAKAYDEAIKYAQYLMNERCKEGTDGSFYCADLQKMFPELTESEDERIRKALTNGFNKLDKSAVWYNGITNGQILTWLEKQGNLMGALQEANKKIGELVEENYYLKEQGEQKPANKVIEEEKPLLEKFKQAVYDCAWGKVTCKKEGETEEEYANRWAEQLLVLVRDWADDYIDSREDVIRRRFFDKGKQSMYKPAWSKEDEDYFDAIIAKLEITQDDALLTDNQMNFLKSLKDRVQPQSKWSEEDENIFRDIVARLHSHPDVDKTEYDKSYHWLKSLRPQKQEQWNEQDIEMIDWLIRCCEKEYEELCNDRYGHQDIVSDLKRDCRKKWDWLESLKSKVVPQKQWKPSEEQIRAIETVVKFVNNAPLLVPLKELLEQLKKL